MKKKYIISGIIGIMLTLLCAFVASYKITYVENPDFSINKEDFIEVNTPGTEIQESLKMPFKLVKACTVHVSNYGKDSNSRWEFLMQDAKGRTVVKKRFNFMGALNGDFYKIDFARTVRVKKDDIYTIKFKPLKINDVNKLVFSIDGVGSRYAEGAVLSVDGEEKEGTLCLTLQGGDVDYFWVRITIFIGIVIILCVWRGMKLADMNKDWSEDTLLRAMLVGAVVFLLYLPYADTRAGLTLMDENDNISAGMLIASGRVIYRDYVSQHMPFAYYLCAVYSLLGASSVEQMRILFYLTLGIAWAGMYVRYHKEYGNRIMFWIPVLVSLFSKALIGLTASMVMSDVIQEISMVLLLLEFMQYRRNRELGWDRAIVVSLGVWMAFGSVFISAYSIFILSIGFLILEIGRWWNNGWKFKEAVRRYLPLMICGIIPPTVGVVYLTANGALYQCYKQAYLLNREVYSNYQDIGGNLFAPFFTGIYSMFDEFGKSLLDICNANSQAYSIFLLLLIGSYVSIAFTKVGKEKGSFVYWVFLTFFICAGASRGVGNTHGLAFWGLLITIVIIEGNEIWKTNWHPGLVVMCAVIFGLLLRPYWEAVIDNMTKGQYVVNSEERRIIEETEVGDQIFIDTYSYSPVYFIAKGRYPANRAGWVLPWFMDWYEEWAVQDLMEKQPEVVIWKPDLEIWGWNDFCHELKDYVCANYMRANENAFIWERIE